MKKLIYILVLLLFYTSVFSQVLDDRDIFNNNFENVRNIETPQNMKALMKTDKSGNVLMVYDPTNWRKLVDEAWGQGISTEAKLKIFDHYWDTVSTFYAAFPGLRLMNWDSAAKAYRDEISAGVSKGRFLAVMNQLILKLNDAHTFFWDIDIYKSSIYPGLPMVNPSGDLNFAGCLTILPDSTALVYNAVPDNVFELVPGDIILGYNNRKLGYLTKEVLDKQLPIQHIYGQRLLVGSTYETTWHKMMIYLASSWNLYDTIDVLKTYGAIKHYPTNLMVGTNYASDCYEIIPPQGIKLPNYKQYINGGNKYSYGIISGTNIGYVSMLDCRDVVGDSLYNIFKYFCETKHTDGIIFDIRSNFGGYINSFSMALSYIYDKELINWFGVASRVNKTNRLLLTACFPMPNYNLYQNDNYFFNKPIALLTGPNAGSAGDVLPIYFRNHPSLKIFGKPTAGAFGSRYYVNLQQPGVYIATIQNGNFYLVADNGKYLSHSTLKIDFPVWLTAEGAANNRDDVIDAAVKWINENTDIEDDNKVDGISIFPNPARDYIEITLKPSEVSAINIYNILGEIVMSVGKGRDLSAKIDVSTLLQGIYYLTIKSGNKTETTKFEIVK